MSFLMWFVLAFLHKFCRCDLLQSPSYYFPLPKLFFIFLFSRDGKAVESMNTNMPGSSTDYCWWEESSFIHEER